MFFLFFCDQKATVLAKSMQLHEALGLLQSLRNSELSAEQTVLEDEIDRIDAEMQQEGNRCKEI